MRVVSLVPSWTETLFALGLGAGEVVGVTKFCVHPADRVGGVARVGGTKNPDVAAVVALRPDLVVVNSEENRLEDVEALRAAGLAVHVTSARTVLQAEAEIVGLGRAVGRVAEGLVLASRVASVAERVGNRARGRARVRVYCPIWRRDWMSFNGDTFAHDVLRLAGADNVFGDAGERYPRASPAEAVARGASAAFLPSEPYPFGVKHVDELVAAGFARERVRLVDGEALTWYGARMLEGLPRVAGDVAALG